MTFEAPRSGASTLLHPDPKPFKISSMKHVRSIFAQRVIDAVLRVPAGSVATYGQIAFLAGNPRGVRGVVWILHSSSNQRGLPWHRIVNRNGKISLRPGDGYEEQKLLLLSEGIVFDPDDRIDLARFLWRPV